ncbi:hypothetical protein ACFX2I_022380 [Malus domestica]
MATKEKKTIRLPGSVDVGVVEIVLERVEEIGVGQLALAHDALAERLDWVDVVNVHGHGGPLIVHVAEEVHRCWPHHFKLPLPCGSYGYGASHVLAFCRSARFFILSGA